MRRRLAMSSCMSTAPNRVAVQVRPTAAERNRTVVMLWTSLEHRHTPIADRTCVCRSGPLILLVGIAQVESDELTARPKAMRAREARSSKPRQDAAVQLNKRARRLLKQGHRDRAPERHADHCGQKERTNRRHKQPQRAPRLQHPVVFPAHQSMLAGQVLRVR